MKSIMKSILGLQMTALFLTAALASPAAAENPVPFKGFVHAVETSHVQFPTLFVDASGSGIATHLGRFTVTYEFEVNLLTIAATGSAQFIAANGDSVFTESCRTGFYDGEPRRRRYCRTAHHYRRYGSIRWRHRELHRVALA